LAANKFAFNWYLLAI